MHNGKLTRERLLDEAMKLVQQRGFRATSVNDVLMAAGVKKGALYHHFPGKDDLGLAVLERAAQAFLASVDDVLGAATPWESLDRFFASVFERHKKKGFQGGCLFGNTALEMSDAGARYADSVSRVFQEWSRRIEAVIHAGQKAGQIRTDLPADDLAQVVVSTIEGGIMLSRLKKEEQPLKACLESLKVFLRSETQ